jgi:hypothetical protein
METAFGSQTKEHPMQRSSFDFDVVTGPAPTRSAPKPESKPAPGAEKPAK